MIVCLNKVFARLFKKADIDDEDINEAISEIVQGNCIPLGHKLYKKRIASRYQGKRGAYRGILYYRSGDLMVFMYLFAKNDRENITPKEMKELILIARLYDTLQGQAIENAINKETLKRWAYETK
jgi:hypothetical protein